MTYKLIVADLDGTLKSESKPDIAPRVIDAVRRAQERGVRVVLATGRMHRTAERFISDLGLRDFASCDHGATILQLPGNKTVLDRRVPLEYVLQVAEFAGTRYTLTACVDGEMYTNRVLGDEPQRRGDVPIQEHLQFIPDFRLLPNEPQKLLFLNDVVTTDRVLVEMKSRFSGCMQVIGSSDRRVELTHLEASKGLAAAWLAAYWNIPHDQVIALGDHDNDRSMIEWAGLGVAMGNGIASLKAIADFIAPTVDEDGAAFVIEKFVLNV